MKHIKKYTLFIFHRDLRLIDNIGLTYTINNYKNIIPIFIFTPEQITNKNKFKSDNAIQFMIECLKELNNELKKYKSKLHIFNGDNINILKSIIEQIKVVNIVFNMDYTPYSIQRDNSIKDFCNKNNINCKITEDYLLGGIGKFLKSNRTPYIVYNGFKNNAKKFSVKKPNIITITNLTKSGKLNTIKSKMIKYKINKDILLNGGRKNGLDKLNKIKTFELYDKNRNLLKYETTHLSAYIKFGCLSIREVYHEIIDNFGKDCQLINQLYWRELYYYIVYYFPKVLNGKRFNNRYGDIKWNNNKTYFKKWCNGETGFPIVDAGMRELNKTGYMHNRARLITSNFLNRLLGCDWRLGERYFAVKLIDYDPAVNNGNWQWIASTGVDLKPFKQRVFNPWTQSKKSDLSAEYIKKWIPELNNIPNKHLYNWENDYNKYNLKELNYPEMIIDYKTQRLKSFEMYE
tara:strand:- start:583 stop:1962 length:1380 start_codon:yes stop_codon:yes gene_type:complete